MPITNVELAFVIHDTVVFVSYKVTLNVLRFKLLNLTRLGVIRIGKFWSARLSCFLWCVKLLCAKWLEAFLFHFVMLDKFVGSNVVDGFLLCDVLTDLVDRFNYSLVNLNSVDLLIRPLTSYSCLTISMSTYESSFAGTRDNSRRYSGKFLRYQGCCCISDSLIRLTGFGCNIRFIRSRISLLI